MEITEVRVKLMEDADDRLRAFCSITFDHCFVVRDLKVIDGTNGPFVAMPSRKLTCHCPRCRAKNHLRAVHCNQCGVKLPEQTVRDQDGRAKLYADIAHPINAGCREMIQSRVIAEFKKELERAEQPGYSSRYDEGYGDDAGAEAGFEEEPPRRAPAERTQTHIEPAEATPPPPHQIAKPSSAPSPPRPRADTFGAGIFDE
jgi:stage V sporulation protein G